MKNVGEESLLYQQGRMVCSYCGRLAHRCDCMAEGSRLARFLARGGRRVRVAAWRASPYKRAVPPQLKRRERQLLQRHRKEWRKQLAAAGQYCANCGAHEGLVLDHVLPIARGGRSTLENLQLLCAECNRLKGKLVIDCRRLAPPE